MEDASSCFNSAPMKTTRYIDQETGREIHPFVTGINFAQYVRIPGYAFSGLEHSADSLTGTYKYYKPFSDISAQGTSTIGGDMLASIDGATFDTQHGQALEMRNSSSEFDVAAIANINETNQGQLAQILEKYKNDNNASLRNVKLAFAAELTLPQQLRFTQNSTVSVKDTNNFDVDNVLIDGKRLALLLV